MSWLFLILGLVALWLTRRSPRWGFRLVIFNQCLWAAYGAATAQGGFVVGAVAYSGVALWNIRCLMREG